jgi:hypothetical protein
VASNALPGAGRNSLAVELGWAPPGVGWARHARGARHSVFLRSKSPRMPVPYPRMKTGSRALDARLMASKFCTGLDRCQDAAC